MKTTSEKKKHRVQLPSIEDRQCIWMKAGVVNFKLCDNAYDCTSCPFDKGMSRKVRETPASLVSWKEVMQGKVSEQRECRHMLTGRVQYKLCSNDYRCNVCEFDQVLDEADLSVVPSPIHTNKVSGFAVADGYYYHGGHGWAHIEHGGFVRIGMDDFALKLLGCPTDFHLPKLGSRLAQSEVGWSHDRQEKTAAMLSPMHGVVVATNQKVLKEPELAKKDPYGQGWLMVVEPKGLKQNLRNLVFEKKADTWLNAEAKRLEVMVAAAYGISLAATGGEVVDDIFGNLSHITWEELTHAFLLT